MKNKKPKTNKQTFFINKKQQHFSNHTHEPNIQTEDKTLDMPCSAPVESSSATSSRVVSAA
jgi:hypothetical protein